MIRWALLGDSQGVGVKPALERALRARGDALAFADVTTGASLRALAGKARAMPAGIDRVLIVSGGGNDSSAADAPSRWTADARGLIAAVRSAAPQAPITWAGPMPATEHDAALRKVAVHAQLPSVLGALGVQWVDGFDLAAGLRPRADGVHFDGASYATIAGRLAEALPAGLGLASAGAASIGPGPWIVGGLALTATVVAVAFAFTGRR